MKRKRFTEEQRAFALNVFDVLSGESTIRYRSVADEQVSLRMRIREIAEVRVSWGYPGILVQLRREGWAVNRKRVCRRRTGSARREPR